MRWPCRHAQAPGRSAPRCSTAAGLLGRKKHAGPMSRECRSRAKWHSQMQSVQPPRVQYRLTCIRIHTTKNKIDINHMRNCNCRMPGCGQQANAGDMRAAEYGWVHLTSDSPERGACMNEGPVANDRHASSHSVSGRRTMHDLDLLTIDYPS
jgi:hypothetical protein